MAHDIVSQSLTDIAEAIRGKQVSAVEVTKACIARAEAVQPKINCFILLLADEALAAASKADEALARGDACGPLHGVPLAHKDMYYRAGKISTCGSKIRKGFVAETTSTALKRLEAAGAIYLGGLNMAEFATGPTGHNEHWGRCCNPWNPDYVTGGSSSGSGAATAARAVFGALGSDTGGSIRLPSIMNGVVGVKTTAGLVSRHGLMPVSFTMDTCGPLTRTVRDAARITGVIAGRDPLDPTTSPRPVPDYEAELDKGIGGVRIGVPRTYYYDIATDEIRTLMNASLEVLSGLGAEIVELDVPDMHEPTHMANIVFVVEAAAIHQAWMREWPEDYQAQVRSRYEPGLYLPAKSYVQALDLRATLLREFADAVFTKCDLLHTPGMPFAVPRGDESDVGAGKAMPELIANISWCTRATNYLGIPALCVPCGFTANGLPTDFQLMGRPFSESLLFRAGHAYQGATDWHTRMPPP
jgi:aspartyl-tRNA(Asn)/glutamyl-tRNA(Gln) amidotransferase subunit A